MTADPAAPITSLQPGVYWNFTARCHVPTCDVLTEYHDGKRVDDRCVHRAGQAYDEGPEPATPWLRGDWMQTFTGRAFYPLDPRPDDIDIRDIAHALSMLCRYGGHTRRFLSVAEHCVLMSRAVAPEHALWALLHDATEAYMGDLIRPLKRQLPAYAEAEKDLMLAICHRFGLAFDCPPEVKQADTRILRDEREAMLGVSPQPWCDAETVESLGVTVTGWEPAQAEQEYLGRFAELTGLAPCRSGHLDCTVDCGWCKGTGMHRPAPVLAPWPPELLNARVRFWSCPDHVGAPHRVEWTDGVARCLTCDRTSADTPPSCLTCGREAPGEGSWKHECRPADGARSAP